MSAISTVTLALCLLVVVAAYGVIIATTERRPRELAWTILPALLLVVVLVVSARAAFER